MLLFTILLSLIFGILIGLLISKYFDLSSSQVKSLERKITEEQLKQKRYRESVNEHFNVTAVIFAVQCLIYYGTSKIILPKNIAFFKRTTECRRSP